MPLSPGLLAYMKNNPEIYRKINIKDAIEKERKLNNQTPLIVVDGNCSRLFFIEPEAKNQLTGGQFKLYKRNVEEFVSFFKNLDVRVVAVFDGSYYDQYRDVSTGRKKGDISKCLEVLDAIENNQMDEIKEWQFLRPCNINFAIKSAFISKCEVVTSIFGENAALSYANDNNALAVLSNKTDCAVTQCSWQFWATEDIDYKNETVYIYDRECLARSLKLRVDQLPLFRTMIGNKYIPEEALGCWYDHLDILKNKYGIYGRQSKISKVAKFLHDNPDMSFEEISRKAYLQEGSADLIRKSIQSCQAIGGETPGKLSEEDTWNKILTEALKQVRELKMSPGTFNVLLKRGFGTNISYEDFRKTDIKPADEIWRPVRARIYGILLRDCPNGKTVQEWTSADLDEPTTVTCITPVNGFHNLVDFWARDKDYDLIDVSWRLFCEVLNPFLPIERVISLDRNLVVGVLVLLHMIKPCQLSDNEIKAFLLVNVLCSTYDDVSEFTGTYQINTRALRLSTVLLKGISTMNMLLETLGFMIPRRYVEIWNIFDGALLQDFFDFTNGKMAIYENNDLFIEGMRFINKFKDYFKYIPFAVDMM